MKPIVPGYTRNNVKAKRQLMPWAYWLLYRTGLYRVEWSSSELHDGNSAMQWTISPRRWIRKFTPHLHRIH